MKLCAGEKFLWPVKHILWRDLMWRVTRHTLSLRLTDDQPLTYGRVHHWIPNQTLSGVITAPAPNPL